jgi:putative endonuclease
MNHRQSVGSFGEKAAKAYLLSKGYRVVDTNVKISYKEIDIVARKGGKLVFVEVRTRSNKNLGSAEDNFGPAKVNKLKLAIAMYLAKFKPSYKDISLDLIVVNTAEKGYSITHYHDVA